MGKVTIENVEDFDVKCIFECGQCFRWEPEEDGSFTGIAGGRMVNVASREGTVVIDNTDEADYEGYWRNYLDMDRNYAEIREYLGSRDRVIRQAIKHGTGIRILNQDRWETLVSFIISANNNIPRIKNNINDLARLFGEKAGEYRGREYYSLPSPEVLAALGPEDLAPVRLGYRTKYLLATAGMVSRDGGAVSREKLRGYCGVGPKVASCISLFSMGDINSFPIDTWVRKVMNRLYGIDEKDVKAMKELAEERFSPYGGIAQQYLFYYMREKRL